MKKTVKILFISLMLAFMMVMIPHTTVQAAEEAKLSVDSKTVWVGSDGYTFAVDNINKDDYTIYYTVENKEMAEVNSKTGYIKGISTGEDATTQFYAVLVHNKTGEVTILNAPLYVKEKASRVEITNKELSEVALLAGDTMDFDAVMYNRAGQSTSTRGKYVTDYTIWTSGNTDVATVNRTTGVVTAKKSGKATIYVRTYVYSNGTGNYSAEDSVDVYVIDCIPTCKPTATPTVKPTTTPTVKPTAAPTVRPGATVRPTATPTPTPPVYDGTNLMLSAKQSTRSAITVEFAKDVSKELTKNNLYINNINNHMKLYIKNIKFSEDGKTAEISFWNSLSNESVFTVKYQDCEVLFSTTDGKISYIEVESKFVETMEPTPVNIKVYDSNDVDLTTASILDSLIYECYNGYFDIDDRTIMLYDEGDEATLTVTYEPFDYDSSESYQNCIAVGYYEALERIPVTITEIKVNIGKNVNYSKVQYKIAEDDDGIYVYARALCSDASVKKTEMSEGDFIFESSDPTKLLIADNGLLIPIETGNLDIIVRNSEYPDEVMSVYPIQIIEERDIAKTKISDSSITLTAGLEADTAQVIVSLYDQYGKEMDADDSIEIEPVLTSNNDIQPIGSEHIDLNVLNVNGGMFEAGTYRYKVYYGDFTHTLTIKAVTAKTPTTHKAVLSDTSVDTTYSDDNRVTTEITAKLFSYDSSGHKCAIITTDSTYKDKYYYGYTITKKGDTEKGTLYAIPDDGVIHIPIIEHDINDAIIKTDEGIYTIKYYLSEDGITKSSLLTSVKFTITDSQEKPVIELHTSVIEDGNITRDNIIELFNINGESISSGVNLKYGLEFIDYDVVGSTLWVKSITLHEEFDYGYIEHNVKLNAMITIR